MKTVYLLSRLSLRGPKWLLPVLSAALAVGLGARAAHAQGSIPALRGVYQGSGSDMNCLGAGTEEVTVTITNQVNDNFNGQAQDPGGRTIFLSGTVDSSGHLQGTYDYSLGFISGQGLSPASLTRLSFLRRLALNSPEHSPKRFPQLPAAKHSRFREHC
jgi:hypothetical protein